MMPNSPHNYIQNYEAGLAALKTRPLDRDLQHKTVLALAQAGALDFALTEYKRYGLGAVRDHEDIMALNGRLSKDLYLRSSGAAALKHAKDAAKKYEAAFHNTLGYYSGINSATMAFMAEMPAERVSARIEAIEALLPVSKEVTPTDHYFTEATRAECFLLKGERSKAAAALTAAIDFDPLNYAAHASTLKQFMMILSKRGESLGWLSDFRPPRPLHFAGHIRLKHTAAEQDALQISISDALQQEDVGFGFGALAAGGDILFAESVLEQGAELHVVLPCGREAFKRESVTAFGGEWDSRFEACMEQASSIRLLNETATWPEKDLNRLGGLSAMGHAVLQGQSMSVAPLQMLILNETDNPSYTATHAQDWAQTGHAQYRFVDGEHRALTIAPFETDKTLPCAMKHSEASEAVYFKDISSMMVAAFQVRAEHKTAHIALHMAFDGEDTEAVLSQIIAGGAPQSVLATEALASVLAAAAQSYKIIYAGQLRTGGANMMRCYTIQETAPLAYSVP